MQGVQSLIATSFAKCLAKNRESCVFLRDMSISCRQPRQAACQQLNRSQIKPRLAAGNGGFEILRQPPVASKPAEGSLDHPAPGQYLKTFALVRSLDNLKRPLPEPGQSGFQLLAGVSAVGKDVTQPREEIADRRQYLRRPVAILDVGGVHLGANQMPTGVSDDMALAALDFLPAS